MGDELRASDPSRVGRYRPIRRLGEGGMGVVYLAEGPKGRVALKVVRSEIAHDPEFRTRFRREVQASFRVSGVCTARLLDFDTEADAPWMATEYVEGPSLAALVDERGPLPAEQQVPLAVGLAEALAAIHAEDLVHRDLKPSNVLCAAEGPKVIDFGIAAAADAAPVTRHGMVVGSPGWITPEQLVSGHATAASDIFTWGCLLAYAASGCEPYGTGRFETVFWRVLNQPPYVDRDLLAPPLVALVDAAIAREPEKRPTAEQLLDDLLAAVRPRRTRAPGGTEVNVQQLLHADWEGCPADIAEAPAPPARVSLHRADETAAPAAPVELVKGANVEVETQPLWVDLQWTHDGGADVKVAAVLVDAAGTALGPPVTRSSVASGDGVVRHAGRDRTERGWRDRLEVDVPRAPEPLARVLVVATLDGPTGRETFVQVSGLEVVVGSTRAGGRTVHFALPPLSEERTLLAVEVYRRRGRWRVRAVAQGYAEGLAGLARDYRLAAR